MSASLSGLTLGGSVGLGAETSLALVPPVVVTGGRAASRLVRPVVTHNAKLYFLEVLL